MEGDNEKLDIGNVIEYKEIMLLCVASPKKKSYIEFMEMLKKIVNKTLYDRENHSSSSESESTKAT